MYSPQALATQIDALTSLPPVYVRIREALDRPASSLPEIATVMSSDPALAARVLRMVNSPLYGYSGRIDVLDKAIGLLGLQRVHDLVLAMSLADMFEGIQPDYLDVHRFWHDSVLRGIVARDVSRRNDEQAVSDRMFLVGMLADIGHLALYQAVPALAEEAMLRARTTGEALYAAERRVIGCDHAETGAALLAHWQLPPLFPAIIGAQTNPRLAGEFAYEAAIINLANHVVEAERDDLSDAAVAREVPPIVLAQLELPPVEIGPVRQAAREHLESYLQHFFPGLAPQADVLRH